MYYGPWEKSEFCYGLGEKLEMMMMMMMCIGMYVWGSIKMFKELASWWKSKIDRQWGSYMSWCNDTKWYVKCSARHRKCSNDLTDEQIGLFQECFVWLNFIWIPQKHRIFFPCRLWYQKIPQI